MRKRLAKSKQDKLKWLRKKAPNSVSLIIERGTFQSKRLLAKDEYSNIIELASGSHRSLLAAASALQDDLQEKVSNIQFKASSLEEVLPVNVPQGERHFGRTASHQSVQALLSGLQKLCLESGEAGGS